MNYPEVSRVEVQGTGVVKTVIGRPRSYYSRAYVARIPPDAIQVQVAFPTPLKDTNWVPIGFSITNIADPILDLLEIRVVAVISAPSQSGFTVLLSGPAPTDNYYLNWGIAELTNP